MNPAMVNVGKFKREREEEGARVNLTAESRARMVKVLWAERDLYRFAGQRLDRQLRAVGAAAGD